MAALNYKHLHYFWVVAKAGSITLASQRLHITPQTISGQLSLFEDTLGEALFNRTNRRFDLTDRGKLVLSYAEEIFSLGQELEDTLRLKPIERPLQFRVGICEAVPKSIAYLLIEPALRSQNELRIICREGSMTNLLGELAVHKLDIVIADSPMPNNINIRAFNHLLGECGLTFFATPSLAQKFADSPFPQCLHGAPILLPGVDDAVRPKLMGWLDDKRIVPRIMGEFDDGALMKVFGQAGVGIFAAPSSTLDQTEKQFGVVALGSTKEVTKSFYAISVERKLTHPAVVAISEAARLEIFS
ncbi:MAG: transcriptional activator NhaR [Methylophilaceae bacterium]|nr:transcriptional activator NhaR [Methylophilaceae bacterium]